MKALILSLGLFLAALGPAIAQTAPAQPTRTDLAKDVFVESSPSDFVLTAVATASPSRWVQAYKVGLEEAGRYTLLTFLNGKLWRLETVQLPGVYRINVRGLAPGTYRLTLQAVSAGGRLGGATQTIVIE